MATSKGFTGQYNDNLSGLDYYGSRYYDPTAGVFLSADPVQGDLAGTNPYEYVGSNPETNTDPSGQMYTPPPQGGGSPLPPVEPRGGWGNWGSGSGTSHLPPSSCGDTVQSGCLLGRLAAQTDWQGQVQVSVHIGLSNGGGLFCHAASGGVAVSVGFGGFATLSMSRTGSGCFSSGNGDVTTTTTTTVQGSSVTPVDTCFSMQCISEGAQGAADKPTDGEEVGAGSGGEELAAFFEEEGDGGNGGNGPGVGGDEPETAPTKLYHNQVPADLPIELNSAENLGVKPVKPGEPGFDQIVNEGTIKWVVTPEGELYIIPHTVKGVEIYHTVINGGGPVIAAGEAEIAGADGVYVLIDINNYSGHYKPDAGSEEIGREVFNMFGII